MSTLWFLIPFQLIILSVMLIGLVSLVTLIVPGLTIIWISAIIYAVITGFSWYNIVILVFLTILMIVGGVIDNIMMGASAKYKGASWLSLGLALLGGIAGSIFYPPFGGLIAALIILFLVELIKVKFRVKEAWESLKGLMAGCGWGVVLRIMIGVLMILWWLVWIGIDYARTYWFL